MASEFYPRVRVAILAIGTEITEGQILDRNSRWLSQELLDAFRSECELVEHRSVPDHRSTIQEALKSLSEKSELVFVTGGLGPTSDDFTREEVSKFASAPLEWSEEAWNWVKQRLSQRGASVSENQKQQCYFPRDAILLRNSQGTAYGFWLQLQPEVGPPDRALASVIVTMPGPPTEIRAIWKEGLRDRLVVWIARWREQLLKQGQQPRARSLHIVRTMGLGEGALASGVEEIVAEQQVQFPDVGELTLGYRAHVPYVEVKIWSEPQQVGLLDAALSEIRKRYRSFIVNEGDADVADGFINRIVMNDMARVGTFIFDEVTSGEFYWRLHKSIQRRSELEEETRTREEALRHGVAYFQARQHWRNALDGIIHAANVETFFLEMGSNSRELVLKVGAEERVLELPLLASDLTSERGRKWATEMALREWSKKTI